MSTKHPPNARKRKVLRAKYRFPDDYNPAYVNGAWGGLNPHGEIAAHFYMERLGLPKEQAIELADDGTVVSTKTVSPADHTAQIVRMVNCGIIMDLSTARSIHRWLGDKIAIAEAMQAARTAREKATPDDERTTVQQSQR